MTRCNLRQPAQAASGDIDDFGVADNLPFGQFAVQPAEQFTANAGARTVARLYVEHQHRGLAHDAVLADDLRFTKVSP